ncbi:hypothetical protein [Micromonospora arborensis]|uniref:hypothetical protein n=1 Tax=Micromonospora arborensis TaxID=2116518 RepID=UPI003717014E
MTTVVAAAVNGTVYMAADTMTNIYERPVPDGAKKIVRLPAGDGEVLLAVTGAGGLIGVAEALLKIDGEPKPDEDPQQWAFTVARAVTELATENGLIEGGQLDGSLLLGWNGRLWTLVHAMAVPHKDGRAALGSGEGPAIGALDALLDRDVPPATAVAHAAGVGCKRDRYSGLPLQFEQLDPRT